ncbi:hypothetical protein AAG906_036977 [Vitis piasezkii]
MTSNPRAVLRRGGKRLLKHFDRTSVKRTPEVSHEELISDALTAQVAPSNTIRQVPCFTMLEPPAPGIDALFPLTRQYFVDRMSVLQCIHPMQQYTVVETTEVGVAAIRNLMRQRSSLFRQLEKAISNGGRLLKETEEESEVAKAKARRMGEEKEKKELEELRAGFAAEKEELKEDYQNQVDEMFFFGYQCCMRKNNITHDIPNYLYDEEDATVSGPA